VRNLRNLGGGGGRACSFVDKTRGARSVAARTGMPAGTLGAKVSSTATGAVSGARGAVTVP